MFEVALDYKNTISDRPQKPQKQQHSEITIS